MNSPSIATAILQSGHRPTPYRQRGPYRPWYHALLETARRRWLTLWSARP
jgi:hypothetical protein